MASLIETGSHYGELTSYLTAQFKEIYSIELSESLYTFNVKRFENEPHVTIVRGDSGDKLSSVIEGLNYKGLIFLDAYYSGGISARGALETPVKQEIDAILKSQFKGVVVLNNLRCLTGANEYPKKLEVVEKLKNEGYAFHFEKDLLIWEML